MSKRGYNCAVWTNKHNKFLEENFAFMDNEELAKSLNKKFTTKEFVLSRTPDAVRKQLNSLMLRRPKKSDIKTLEKKAGKDNFFKMVKKGQEVKEKQIAEQQRQQQKEASNKKEREWAKRVYDVGTTPTQEVKQRIKPKQELVWLHLDEKTSIQIPKGEEETYKARWLKYKINKYGQ